MKLVQEGKHMQVSWKSVQKENKKMTTPGSQFIPLQDFKQVLLFVSSLRAIFIIFTQMCTVLYFLLDLNLLQDHFFPNSYFGYHIRMTGNHLSDYFTSNILYQAHICMKHHLGKATVLSHPLIMTLCSLFLHPALSYCQL